MTTGIARAAMFAALAVAPGAAQDVARTIDTGPQPMAVAVNESSNKAYVVNHNNSTITVIDGRTRSAVATIKTGSGPEGIAVNPVTNRIYVANPGDGSVTVIDGVSDTVITSVRAGSYPQALAVNPATNKIYAANNYGHSVTVIDGATHTTATVRVGQGPRAIVANPVTNRIYTANYGSRDATVIDGATNTPVSVAAGKHPWAIAADTKANRIYVVNEDSASVTIVNGATGEPRNVTVGEIPFAVAANPATGKAYVLTYVDNTMAVIDGVTGLINKTVTLPGRPAAVAVNPKTNQIYVAAQRDERVWVLDGASNVVTAIVKTGAIPYAIAADSASNRAYVANFGGGSATVIAGDALSGAGATAAAPRFRVLALAERASGDHQRFVDAARVYLNQLAAENNFVVDYITAPERLDEKALSAYRLFIQLNYPPYRWAPVTKRAFEDYITQGKGGWIGFHHAALLGEFDGYPMDPWFSTFLGGIRFTGYLPDFAKATVKIEDRTSPLTEGLPESFVIDKEEWYTWSRSPRPNVHVLAAVDESSYVPNTPTKMGGDHPVVWSNPNFKGRNVYIFMGHHPGLFDSPEFVRLFRNAIFWGAGQ